MFKGVLIPILAISMATGIIPGSVGIADALTIQPAGQAGQAPHGQVTLELDGGAIFTGEASFSDNSMIGTGSVQYPNGEVFVGGFKNGKPDGLCTLALPNRTTFLFVFQEGQLLSTYRAQNVDLYIAESIQPFRAAAVKAVQAASIEVVQAAPIEVVQAPSIEPVQAASIEVGRSQEVESYTAAAVAAIQATPVEAQDPSVTPDLYQAEVAKLNPPMTTTYTGGSGGADYSNPLVAAWTAHMAALPYLVYGGMSYQP